MNTIAPSPKQFLDAASPELLRAIITLQGEIALAGLDLEKVMSAIVRSTHELTNADGVVIELQDGDEMVYRATAGPLAEGTLGIRLKASTSLSGLSVKERRALKSEDTEKDPRVDLATCRKVGLRSLIAVPLVMGPAVPGVLKVMAKAPNAFSGSDESILALLAGFLSTALANAEEADRRERHLKESERTLDQIFSASPAMMVFLSVPEMRLERANQEYLKWLGRDDVVGKRMVDFLPELEAQGYMRLIDEVVRSRAPYSNPESKMTFDRDGKQVDVYFDFSYQPLKREDGTIYGIAGQAYNVTEKVVARKSLEAAKKAVENERENFRNLFRQTPEMVCILKGRDHVFEFVNEAHVRALGFDATGMAVRVAQPESVEVHGILDNVYRTGVTAELREIPVTVTDRLRYFNLTYAARRDDDGCINGVMILGTEVTDQVLSRTAAAESESRLKFALASANMGTWTVDLRNDAVVFSEESVKIFGASASHGDVRTIIGKSIHPDDQARAAKELQTAIASDNPYHSEYRIVRGEETRWLLSRGRARYDDDGRPLILSGISMDITDRKHVEEQLLVAKDEAERANRLKSAFLANMSHEIRTPLGAMIGFADLLRDPGLTDMERSNFIDILSRNGESLSVIINDILDLSKVEAGHLTLEYTDARPEQIAADVVSLLRVKAKEKDLALDFFSEESTPAAIVSDPTRVRQILLNLVGNAIKFTAFGSVKVRSFGCTTDAGRPAVCFEVTDTGIGISPDHQERVFEMFVQADGTMTRRFGGTGLGLALSRRLARALGGDITLTRSEEGVGSTFLVTIEDQPERRNTTTSMSPSQPKLAQEMSAEALKGVRILVVDDAPDNQQLIWRYLTKQGAIVESAENGLIGYRLALAGNHDVVLMDIQMPVMDGYTATQKLRESGYKKPVIALTAHAMTDIRRRALNVGYTDHLPKPINSKELIGTILRHAVVTPSQPYK